MRAAIGLPYVMLALFWPRVAMAELCSTTITCAAPGERSCTCPARSAGPLNFYWRISVQPGHAYRCEMRSGHHVHVLQDACTIPQGAVLTWEACCGLHPAVARFDTTAMQGDEGDVVIKIQVGPTDIPTHVHIVCRTEEEEV